MLDTLITSKTRIKLLLKFFFNEKNSAYLRGLEQEFGEGSNAIRLELNKFEKAGLLQSFGKGNKRFFSANTSHPLFSDLQSLVRKYMGIDTIIENIVNKLGDLHQVFLTGKAAQGLDNGIIEIIFIANALDRAYLSKLITRAEELIQRKIAYSIFSEQEFADAIDGIGKEQLLLLYDAEG